MKLFKRIWRTTKLWVYWKISHCYSKIIRLLLRLAIEMLKTDWPREKIERVILMARSLEKAENKWNHYANAELEELMILES